MATVLGAPSSQSPQQPQDQSQPTQPLLSRVASYSLVNKGFAVYQFAKQRSPQIIKSGVFDLCENVVSSVAQQPLFVKAVETAQLEERGAKLLDRFDNAVEKVQDLNRQGQEIVHTVSRAVYQPLDVALEVVDKYLPESEAGSSQLNEGHMAVLSDVDNVPTTEPAKPIEGSSAAKLTKLTSKLHQVALSKLTTIKLRTAEQLASMHFAVNLIEYAKQNNLVDYAKQHVDEKTIAQVNAKVQQTVAVVQETASMATEVAQAAVVKAKEVVTQTNLAVTKIAKERTEVVKQQINHLALKLQETQWKKQFDQIMGPYLIGLKSQTEKVAVVTLSTLAVVVDFTLQQFKLTKQKEFGQVLSNVASVTRKAVEQTKNLSFDTIQHLEKTLDSVQHTLRELITHAQELSLASSLKYLVELQTRLASALKAVLVPNLAITSASSTA